MQDGKEEFQPEEKPNTSVSGPEIFLISDSIIPVALLSSATTTSRCGLPATPVVLVAALRTACSCSSDGVTRTRRPSRIAIDSLVLLELVRDVR